MELRQLRYFVAAARLGSLVAASRAVHISQPALGYQIKRLEERLGVALFARHSRGLHLTEAGRALLGHAEAVLESLRAAEAALSPWRAALAGNFLFGVTPTAGRTLLPDLLEACAAGPAMSVREGLSRQLFRDLAAGQLDLVLGYEPPPEAGLDSAMLCREALVLVGHPDLVDADTPLPFAQLADIPLVLEDRQQVTRRLVEAASRLHHVNLTIAAEAGHLAVKRELLVRHRRASIAPYGQFLSELRAGMLRARPIAEPALSQALHLAWAPGVPDAVRDFLLATLRRLVAPLIAQGELGWQKADD